MDLLNSVEINKVKVTPLSEWNYLLSRNPAQRCAWPRKSSLLCWWCAHSFDNVPAYLPVKVHVDISKGEGNFVFTGNFCSWNCVKRYAMMLEKDKKCPDGCFYIGLLAYLTVCKGDPCEGEGDEMHDYGLCDCMDTYKGVRLPPSKESLLAFGGALAIETYRKGFHVITEYNKIERNFADIHQVRHVREQAMECKNVKFWGFHYLHYAGPDTSYTTFVNILPLTNRTFDKTTLVLTGNEMGERTQKLEPNKTSSSSSSRKKAAPKARTITRRRSNKSNPPVEISSSSVTTTTTTTNNKHEDPGPDEEDNTIHTTASHSHSHIRRRESNRAVMTNEQVLACNDEQHFYTNSLRGYGNILTSMGIEISRPL